MEPTKRMPSIYDAPPPGHLDDKSAFVGKKPSKVVLVPLEYRRQILHAERVLLASDIKIDTGCVIFPNTRDKNTVVSFDVFGGGPGLEHAVRRLNEWVTKSHAKSARSSAWAKKKAFEYNKQYTENMQQLEYQKSQRFRGPIPSGQDDEEVPKHIITVNWPEELTSQSLTPRGVFGNKLEHLDALRMQDSVWITLQSSHIGRPCQIEIIGYDLVGVQIAKQHLITFIDRVREDASGTQETLHIILDEREGIQVELQLCQTWWPSDVDKVVPYLSPPLIEMDEPGSFRQQDLEDEQLFKIQVYMEDQLKHIRYKKGAYDFAVRLGCAVLSSKDVDTDRVGASFAKDKFLKEIHGKVGLEVKKWLANEEVGRGILHRLMLANEILEPTKPGGYYGYIPASLDQTRPTLQGTWVFRDPNSTASLPRFSQSATSNNVSPPQVNLFVVQIDWTDDEDGKYEKSLPRFYRLETGRNGPKKNMDLNLLELGESRGWHFALESMIPLSSKSVSPVLAGFAQQVTMKSGHGVSSAESFAKWEVTPTVKNYLHYSRLNKTYAFGIKETNYKAELIAIWYPRQKLPVWGLSVRHLEWATHLAELECLSVGSKASWADPVSTFFPDDGLSQPYIEEEDMGMERFNIVDDDSNPPRKGIRLLVNKLMKLSEIVGSDTTDGGIRI
ncbi:hypothetical protein GQ44DRAFT_699494 [Phaeosphaeriaceae sp. PMI808]|nr:hypothetical protein GQ44DRAFT_699494 [Phaeosphaeriaceae sp. PMI808]